MPYSATDFVLINEDMVQTLLILEVLFTHDSKVEDLFCGSFPAVNAAFPSAIISAALRIVCLVKITKLQYVVSGFLIG